MFVGEILHYVVHVDNMSLTKALGSMTPLQKLHKRKPDIKDIEKCGVLRTITCIRLHEATSWRCELNLRCFWGLQRDR